MELSYDEVRRIHRLEKASSKLVELDKDFYNDLNDFLSTERTNYMDSLKSFSVTNMRSFTNLKRMVEEIFAMRSRKILSRALVGSRTKESSEEGLTLQEAKLFKSILSELEKHNTVLNSMFTEGTTKTEKKSQLQTQKIKISKDIPAFVGADMKEYGPFTKDQTIELPNKIAKLLVSRKFGKIEE